VVITGRRMQSSGSCISQRIAKNVTPAQAGVQKNG